MAAESGAGSGAEQGCARGFPPAQALVPEWAVESGGASPQALREACAGAAEFALELAEECGRGQGEESARVSVPGLLSDEARPSGAGLQSAAARAGGCAFARALSGRFRAFCGSPQPTRFARTCFPEAGKTGQKRRFDARWRSVEESSWRGKTGLENSMFLPR